MSPHDYDDHELTNDFPTELDDRIVKLLAQIMTTRQILMRQIRKLSTDRVPPVRVV